MLTSCFERPRGVAVSAIVVVLTVFGLAASPAFASYDQTSTYSTAGTYTLTVPQYATSLNIVADGAGGAPGGDTPDEVEATGGIGGGAARMNLTVPLGGGSFPAAGDTLQLIVGAAGEGGPGGVGDATASGGGAGGGATVLSDLSSSQTGVILVAGGVGGGGGGGGGAGGSCVLPGYTHYFQSAGSQTDGAATLTFAVSPPPLKITSPNSVSAPSTARTVLFPVIVTGSPAPSLTLTNAPSWLTITNSGFLEGAFPPHTVGTFIFDISAYNGQSVAGQIFTLHVTAPPLAQRAPTSVTGTVGSPLSVRLNAGGASGPYTWSLAGPPLPAGLS